jgi:hypothetical protein
MGVHVDLTVIDDLVAPLVDPRDYLGSEIRASSR